MQMKGAKVIVLGAAKSGISAAKVLLQLGATVTVTDITPLHKMPEPERQSLKEMDIRLVTGSHPINLLDGAGLVVKNPGIPPNIEFLQAADQRGIPWISELELASKVTQAEIVAITGTNGKTTTTALLAEILHGIERPVAVGGNIGVPLTTAGFGLSREAVLIVEASSFQLEDCYQLHPKVAVYTNISPDHLDRHGSMDKYIAAKLRLVRNQTDNDFVIYNMADASLAQSNLGKGQQVGFSMAPQQGAACFIDDGWFWWRERKLAPIGVLKVPGGHNLQNALAAIAAAKVMQVDDDIIIQGLKNFSGVEHRLEYVRERDGIQFYNDSKATNPESTSIALHAFDQKVLLLAGGYDKDANFEDLARLSKNNISHLIAYGATRDKIARQMELADFTQFTLVEDLDEAFQHALTLAGPGDVVLFSPACASWDQYANFEERGRHFKALVDSLGG